jgi:hypothetical protein
VITFPDVSNHQSTTKPPAIPIAMNITGAAALVAKASEGDWFTDPLFGSFRARAEALGIPFSGYHWIDLGDIGGQARRYFAAAGDTPCMIDAEADGATVPRIGLLVDELRRLGVRVWGVYLPRWWWERHLGSPSLAPLVGRGLALVSSAYTTDEAAGWAPYGGMAPTIWQYTDAQALNGQHVDFNAYRGTVESLRSLFTGKARNVSSFLINVTGTKECYISDGFDIAPVRDDFEVRRALAQIMPTVTVPGHDQAYYVGSHARAAGGVDIDTLTAALTAAVHDNSAPFVDTAAIATATMDQLKARLQS